MKEKSFKNLLKNNIVSVIVLVLLISVVGVFAGNVYITDGDVDVDDDFTVDTNTLFANATSNNVGIGTTSPQADFHLKDGNIELPAISANTIFLIEDSTIAQMSLVGATGCLIQFGDAADENSGIIQYIHSSNAMTFRTSGAGEDMRIDSAGKVGIGTNSPSYPLEVNGDSSGISLYTSANVSATGFITRTSVFDKSQGNALDFIKDADYYVSDGEIDHSKFYGYAGEFEITDYSRPETEEYSCIDEETEEEAICESIVYPYKTTEEGVSLDAEIDVLRQAVYELKTELCKKDDSYEWC